MTVAYDLARTRRLLLLLSAATRASTRGRGVPLDRAVALTGAKSARQVVDDVDALQALWADPASGEEGVDLYVEDGEVHVTYGRAFGAPPAFSLAEGAVLRAVLEAFEKTGGRAVTEAARKLRKAVPEPLRREADRLAHGLDVADAPPEPAAGLLRDAIERRLETALEYRAVGDEATTRRRVVEPRVLFPRDGRWYLAAWNVEKAEEHLYRLDRIASVEPGARVFDAHRGPPVARYATGDLYFASGAEREVTLRFRGAAARAAQARYGARASAQPDGTVTVAIRVTPGNYLYGVVLGHGGDAAIDGPPDVRAAFDARVAELARLYASR